MSTAPIMSVSINSEHDVSNVRNVARLSAQVLNFPITSQARIGWAVANLAQLMLTLGYHDNMFISHLHQENRRGIRVMCNGNWLRMVQSSWLEKTVLSDISQWVDHVELDGGAAPSLIMDLWAPDSNGNGESNHGTTSLIG
jgi:hypothetical protein